MPFTLYAAADLYGQKVNLELCTPTVPAIKELIDTIQEMFNSESSYLKPPSKTLQNVKVAKLQVYSDERGAWEELTTTKQLTEFAQLYVLQADLPYQESQQPIPASRKPKAFRPMRLSPIAAPRTPNALSNQSTAMGVSSEQRTPSRQVLDDSYFKSGPVESKFSSPHRASAVPQSRTLPLLDNGPASPGREILAQRPIPANPTQQDKIDYLFEEMDINGNGVIEPEEFRRLVRLLAVDIANDILGRIFSKCDSDRDGVLSQHELRLCFTEYPTLLDAMFFRIRDIREARALQAQLAEERSALEAARDYKARAAVSASEASRAIIDATVRTRDAENTLAAQVAREAELRHARDQCETEVNEARQAKDAAAGRVSEATDREASLRANEAKIEADLREANLRLSDEQDRLVACHEKERQLQMMLQEAQRDTERQRRLVLTTESDTVHLKEAQQSAAAQLANVQRDVRRLAEQLLLLEREEALKHERQRELGQALRSASDELSRIKSTVDERRAETVTLTEREKQYRAICAEAEAAVIAAERRVVSREQDLLAFNKRRVALEQQERPLIEQEIRLREQRDTLEEKESRFRKDSVTYFDSSRKHALSPEAPPPSRSY